MQWHPSSKQVQPLAAGVDEPGCLGVVYSSQRLGEVQGCASASALVCDVAAVQQLI